MALRVHCSTMMQQDDRKLFEPTHAARRYVADRLNAWFTGATQGTDVLFDVEELEWLDGGWTLDGMSPIEWCEAMMGE